MSNKSSSSGGGIGVLGLLGVAFVVLKLMGYIDWSWWWVTAPFWVGLAFVLAFMAVMVAGAGLIAVVLGLWAWLTK